MAESIKAMVGLPLQAVMSSKGEKNTDRIILPRMVRQAAGLNPATTEQSTSVNNSGID